MKPETLKIGGIEVPEMPHQSSLFIIIIIISVYYINLSESQHCILNLESIN